MHIKPYSIHPPKRGRDPTVPHTHRAQSERRTVDGGGAGRAPAVPPRARAAGERQRGLGEWRRGRGCAIPSAKRVKYEVCGP